MLLKIVYLLTCRMLGLAVLAFRGDRAKAGQHTLTAEDPVPPDLRDALALIERPEGAH